MSNRKKVTHFFCFNKKTLYLYIQIYYRNKFGNVEKKSYICIYDKCYLRNYGLQRIG
jgi:hypothetical protein